MKIAVCDYSGHPFQVQLSRALAERGHEVLHLSFAGFQTPKGALQKMDCDPESLSIEAIVIGEPFAKFSYVKRWFQERSVGWLFVTRLSTFYPDVVIGANFPLDTLTIVSKWVVSSKIAFIFWQQDIYSQAISSVLKRQLGFVGAAIGVWYKHLEREAIMRSSATIVIADEFRECLVKNFNISCDRVQVIPNWAPLDEITPQPKRNAWSVANGLADSRVVAYTGTLGLKHNPDLLIKLAEHLRHRPDVVIVVTSEGPGMEWLRDQAQRRALSNMRLLGFQPYENYGQVLGAADVVVAMLEAEAGVFSVPSKVLSYMSAGKPTVLSAPKDNLSTRLVEDNRAGRAVPPGDTDEFVLAVSRLIDSEIDREAAGQNALHYARNAFEITTICEKFEALAISASQARRL